MIILATVMLKFGHGANNQRERLGTQLKLLTSVPVSICAENLLRKPVFLVDLDIGTLVRGAVDHPK